MILRISSPLLSARRIVTVAECLVVNIIRTFRFVVARRGLACQEPLTPGGARHSAAFLSLVPLMAHRGGLRGNRAPGYWWHLVFIGISAYAVGNGIFFRGLQHLPATIGSFLLMLFPISVLFLAILRLQKTPTRPDRGWSAGPSFSGWRGSMPPWPTGFAAARCRRWRLWR